MEKYKNKYRTDSIRLKGYDYSKEGSYFITICTKNHISFFGNIEKGIMKLNTSGKIVADEWMRTAKKRDRAILGEWVVMPNHFHAIIYLRADPRSRDASNASPNKGYKNKFGPQRNNISSIIRGFKSSCTSQIRKTGITSFGWQRGFHDHIIRSQKSLTRIEEYIRKNPLTWYDDRYHLKTK